MTRKDWEEILTCYWRAGGFYEIPTEIVNDMLGEFEDLYNEIDRLRKGGTDENDRCNKTTSSNN